MVAINPIFAKSSAVVLFFGFVIANISFSLSSSLIDKNLYQNNKNNLNISLQGLEFGAFQDKYTGPNHKYLFDHSVALLWEKNDGTEQKYANGFLINVANENTRTTDIGDKFRKINLYVGTTLSFVKEIFNNISDFETDVNDATSAPTIDSKSSNKDDHNLYFSNINVKNKNDNAYSSPIFKFKDTNNLLDENTLIKLDNKNVQLVYAAADLSINKELENINININNSETLMKKLESIKTEEREKIQWSSGEENKKFAADFAVIKITVYYNELNNNYVQYIENLTIAKNSIKHFNIGDIKIIDHKTPSVIGGNWKILKKEDDENLKFDNFIFSLIKKKDKLNTLINVQPSTITSQNYSEYFELSFFNNKNNISKQLDLSSEYEIHNAKINGYDNHGVVIIEYQLKHKTTNTIFKKKHIEIFKDFKKIESQTPNLINFSNFNETQTFDLDDIKKKHKFLSQKGEAKFKWNATYYDNPYFDYKNVYQTFQENKNAKNEENYLNSWESFEFKNKKYVNIGHHLTAFNNKNTSNIKGSLFLSNNWEQEGISYMLGINAGPKKENNKSQKILLFSSPFRYDLLSLNNNFSKPSLLDSLKKKSLAQFLAQPSIFS